MPEGLSPRDNKKAETFYDEHGLLDDVVNIAEKRLGEAQDRNVPDVVQRRLEENVETHKEASDANLWRSSQHVKENLPQYVEQGQKEAAKEGVDIDPMTPERAAEVQEQDRQ